MPNFIRTATKATGGITADEKARLDDHAKLWIKRAMRTDPIEPDKIIPAVKALYAAAGLKEPRVVIAPSPLVMAFAYGASAAIWHVRKSDATYAATYAATHAATYAATYAATDAATDAATRTATYAATDAATDAATHAATRTATRDATYAATYAATHAATDAATHAATDAATDAATYAATDAATDAATRTATRAATRTATRTATYAATHDATYAATDAATRTATDAATDAATRDATHDATRDATRTATDAATRAATRAATHAATDAATRDATDAATRDATHDATDAATDAATHDATDAATDDATRDATDAATHDATDAATACRDLAGPLGLACAGNWWNSYQGGNMWAGYDCYLTSWRDVIGLQLPEYDRYSAWERCAIHGGFRVLHEEFCIVSDFPEIIRVDAGNRPHCEDGPSHRWRDGWALYHWHGVKVPAHWIEDRANLDPREVIKAANVEQRAAGAAICGWPKMLSVLKAKTIDAHESSEIGSLIELTLPGLDQPGRFLKAYCPRNGLIVEGVPRVSDIDGLPIETAIAAQAWRIGDPSSEFQPSPRRT